MSDEPNGFDDSGPLADICPVCNEVITDDDAWVLVGADMVHLDCAPDA